MSTSPFACLSCRGELHATTDRLTCRPCGHSYRHSAGIYRFLSTTSPDLRRFHRQYLEVRSHDGSHRRSAAEYRQLPEVSAADPRAGEWAIRKQSYERLISLIPGPTRDRAACRVADLGAGNGWLSHRLTQAGCETYAVDRLDDDADGLGACRYYDTSFVCVQADFDALPFRDAAFDAVVLNGSLHYSPSPPATLAEARRLLRPGGALVVMDSPMFTRQGDGEAMVAAQLQRIERNHSIDAPMRPGVGFLTFEVLNAMAQTWGLRARFTPSRGPLAWRVRRQMSRWRLHRAPAAFGVWVAQ